jgi:thymidine phosphorylase
MIAGRGLGFTGGTIDKLEAIPGFRTALSLDEQKKQMATLGGFIVGQSPDLAPLDRRLYALRDVTGTVPSLPLICGSILSKKISEGLTGLVMDIKTGSGAFAKTLEESRALAQLIREVGQRFSLPITGVISHMNAPLGDRAGHGLEIEECRDILKGKVDPGQCRELSLKLTAMMVKQADPKRADEEIHRSLESHLTSGRAWEVFDRWIRAQGGDPDFVLEPAPRTKPILALEKGVLTGIDTEKLGIAMILLGGGRRKLEDTIDPRVGLSQIRPLGTSVEKRDPLCLIHGSHENHIAEAAQLIQGAYRLEPSAPSDDPRIVEEW